MQYRLKKKEYKRRVKTKLCQAVFTVDEINCAEKKLMSVERLLMN